MKSRLLLRRRRHVLNRPPRTNRLRRPVPVTMRLLRQADAWVERVRKVIVTTESVEES